MITEHCGVRFVGRRDGDGESKYFIIPQEVTYAGMCGAMFGSGGRARGSEIAAAYSLRDERVSRASL